MQFVEPQNNKKIRQARQSIVDTIRPSFCTGVIRRLCGSPISLHWAAQRFAVQFGAALHQRVDDIVVSVQAGMPSSQNVGQRGHPAAGKHSGSDIVFACVKQKDMA